jgi:hypothetical protein
VRERLQCEVIGPQLRRLLLLLHTLLLPTLHVLLLLLLWLQLWRLLLLLWLALLLLAAAVKQLVHVPCSIHPRTAHSQCCMQQLVPEDPQRPRQPLVADVAVRCHPRQVTLGGTWQAPDQWILGVIHCWLLHCLQLLRLPLRRELAVGR